MDAKLVPMEALCMDESCIVKSFADFIEDFVQGTREIGNLWIAKVRDQGYSLQRLYDDVFERIEDTDGYEEQGDCLFEAVGEDVKNGFVSEVNKALAKYPCYERGEEITLIKRLLNPARGRWEGQR